MKKQHLIIFLSACMSCLAVMHVQAGKPSAPAAAPDAQAQPEAPTPPVSPDQKPFVGVVTEKLSTSTAAQLGMEPGVGLTVSSIVKNSAAEEYGLEKYDILMEMDGQWLTSVSHFSTLLRLKKPGDQVNFRVFRKGQTLEIPLTLGAKGVHRKKGHDWEWKFEEKMEEIGQRLEELAEREEIIEHMENLEEYIDADQIEENVRSALEKARYHVNQWVSEDGSHTSIVHSGNARTIVTTDDGTIIIEGLDDGSSKVLAIDDNSGVVFDGVVTKKGGQLESAPAWVKKQYEKLENKRVRVIVSSDIDIDTDVEHDSESED